VQQPLSRSGMTRAGVLRGGSGALAGAVLAACGTVSTTPDFVPSGQPVAVTHWFGNNPTSPEGDAQVTGLQQRTAELRDTVGVSLTVEAANTEKVMVAAAGGTPPTTANIPYWDAARLFVAGMTRDPDEALKKNKDWAAHRKALFPGMLDSSLWRGKLTALPFSTNHRVVFYDKAVLAKAGVPVPAAAWNRAEFTDKITRASSPPDRWGFTLTPGYLDFFIFYGAAGGAIQSKDQSKWTFDNDVGRDTLRFLHDLIYARSAVPNPPPGELMRNGDGKVAFDMTVNSRITTYRQRGMDVAAAPVPAHTTKFTLAHGWNTALLNPAPSAPAPTADAAGRFALWLTSPTFLVPFHAKSDTVPISRATLEHKDFQTYLAGDSVIRLINEQASLAHRVPASPSLLQAQTAVSEFIEKALTNQLGINAAVAEGQRAAQVLLDQDLRQAPK
jgi:multiple sugar transport system substrate-binding protein